MVERQWSREKASHFKCRVSRDSRNTSFFWSVKYSIFGACQEDHSGDKMLCLLVVHPDYVVGKIPGDDFILKSI